MLERASGGAREIHYVEQSIKGIIVTPKIVARLTPNEERNKKKKNYEVSFTCIVNFQF